MKLRRRLVQIYASVTRTTAKAIKVNLMMEMFH